MNHLSFVLLSGSLKSYIYILIHGRYLFLHIQLNQEWDFRLLTKNPIMVQQ